jgi:hypothetical protein
VSRAAWQDGSQAAARELVYENGHLATRFHSSRNCLFCQPSLTSDILSHIRLGGRCRPYPGLRRRKAVLTQVSAAM